MWGRLMGLKPFLKIPAKIWRIAATITLVLAFVLSANCDRDARAENSDDAPGHADALAQMTAPLSASRTLAPTIVLKLHDRAGLEELIREQQDPSSPNYHRWLTSADFARRFGPTPAEVDRVTHWLVAKGFVIDSSSLGTRILRFHAPATTIAAAFGVKFGASANGRLFANLNDPRLPPSIAPLVDWVGGLDNLSARIPHAHFIKPHPNVDVNQIGNAFGPPDIYSFYDETPLLTASPTPIDGRNTDCIAVIEDTDITHKSADVFNAQFGLPAFNYSLEPGTNFLTFYADLTDPGINSDELEALIDLEYAHALAPGANLINYVGDNSTSSISGLGFLDAAFLAIDQKRCGTISISYGICGGNAAFFKSIDSSFAQGAAQGQSIFIASGDEGAANLVFNAKQGTCVVGKKRGVEGLESSPHVTSVGGTMFEPNYDADGNNIGSVSESVWNDAFGAGSGGKSTIFKKPAYQTGLTPKDQARDVPDISFGASPLSPGFYLGLSNTMECCIGGTSVGAPALAGISMLIQQELGERPGPINPELYKLGPLGASAGLRDVTTGDNSFNGVKGYPALPGYDQATGWGTADIADFVAAFTNQ
jgi:subtilase family serine protease